MFTIQNLKTSLLLLVLLSFLRFQSHGVYPCSLHTHLNPGVRSVLLITVNVHNERVYNECYVNQSVTIN